MENLKEPVENSVISNGSDVDMIKVNTPNFFERHFLHILTIFGVGFLVFTFIFQIFLTPICIVGKSMQPTINEQSIGASDYEHCDVVYYKRTKKLKRGDIVVVDAEDYLTNQTDPIIKRIIATGGDTITFDFYEIRKTLDVYVCYYNILLNGNHLSEDYIAEQTCYLAINTNYLGEFSSSDDYDFLKLVYSELNLSNPVDYEKNGQINITLDNTQVFICGDNRNYSTDSRYFGAIDASDVLGVMAIHVPYGNNLFSGILFSIKNKFA